MFADRTGFRRHFPNMDVSAVAAYPYCLGVIFEYLIIFDSFQQHGVSCLMLFFYRRQILEKHSDFRVTFVFGNGAHVLINGSPFLMFPRNACGQIGFCCANAIEKAENLFGVLPFIICCFFENGADLFIAFFFRLTAVKIVFVGSHGFPRECGKQILFCSCTTQVHTVKTPFCQVLLSQFIPIFPKHTFPHMVLKKKLFSCKTV